MNFGADSGFGFGSAGTGGIAFQGANDGLSLSAGIVKLGQAVGAPGNPAQLLESREVPLNASQFQFTPSTVGAQAFNLQEGVLGGVDASSGTYNAYSFYFGFGALLGGGFNNIRNTTTANGDARGFLDNTTFAGTGSIGYAGFDCNAQCFSAGAVTYSHVVGFQARQVFDSVGGTMTDMYGHTSYPVSKNGTLTALFDYYCQSLNHDSTFTTPTVGTRYNFYAEQDTAPKKAAVSWGVYIAGNQPNYFLGNVGIGQAAGVAAVSSLDLKGAFGYSQLRLETSYTPTSSADANGNTGDVAWDANFFYVKTAAGAWKRTALSTF